MRWVISIAALLAFSPGVATGALLQLTLESPLSGHPGDEIHVFGTVRNESGSELFINGFNLVLQGQGTLFELDDSLFDLTVPLSIPASGAGAQVQGELFRVAVGEETPIGTFAGSMSILGGAIESDLAELATADFVIQVIPEPGTSTLMTVGVAAAWLWTRVRRRGRPPSAPPSLAADRNPLTSG